MRNSFYVTTPIYYVNSHPHLGHLYTTIIADTVARFHRQRGKDVFFLTGTDEHGQNIERAAAAKNLPVKEHVDLIVDEFKQAFAPFKFTNDHWVRTTDQYHKDGVALLWKRARDNGYIYKGNYEGWYCANCNLFYNESEVPANLDGIPACPVHERPLDRVAEASYFFKLGEFQERLLKYYEDHPDFIQPDVRRNEVISFVKSGLMDLSVSRVSVKWGIPVPDDPEHTMYVWFDALSNYITAIGYGNEERGGEAQFKRYWPSNLQLVGKDILRFHTVYWPAFLMAAGEEPAISCFAHGMWLSGGRKMSKTLGNVIDLKVLSKYFAPDSVRYFCLREMVFGNDGDFTYEALVDRVNADLASGLGNLSSRTLTMVRNYFDGKVPSISGDLDPALSERVALVRKSVSEAIQSFNSEFQVSAFSKALEAVWAAVGVVDKFLSDLKPWDLAKDPEKKDVLSTVLFTALEALRTFTVLLAPVLPEATQAIWEQMGERGQVAGLSPEELPDLVPGRDTGEVSPVFPRLDKKKLMSEIKKDEEVSAEARGTIAPAEPAPVVAEKAPAPPAAPEGVAYIGIEDFSKVELRVGQILTADPVPKADKLLRFTIDLGEAQPRQVLAGIAQYYEAEKLIGRKVVVVANLAPRKLRGFESQGMILAASLGDEGKPVLAGFLEEVPNGARLK